MCESREHLLRTPPDGDELNASVVELVQVGIRGQLGVEDEFLGPGAGALFPRTRP